ncbi:fasciclin domain-containing protein [Aureitalea marina]|uniref:Fasciclin n=1 Tax=Aureitalea marina TaxID=930804 RepID=A0A2S7KQK6_9FLAO|nr:fasciclin domain-containing protein [Aureitalea marina]PQB04901.1 fasciclin [Aureitalea marina]
MKKLFKWAFVAFLAITVVACSNDDDNNPTNPDSSDFTITNILQSNSDYTSLVAALNRAGLTGALDGVEERTLFAPTNAAFEQFLNDNGFPSLEEVPVDVLTETLLNHVVNGSAFSTDLTTGYLNSLASFGDTGFNLSLFVDLSSGIRVNGVSSVVVANADVEASNGVIHQVDAVIGIPTVVTQATANPDFSVLVEALVAGSTNGVDYVALLSGTEGSPFTVFAPTNDAFAGLLEALGLDSLDQIPVDLLQTVLNYHVIAASNVRAGDLSEGAEVTTFQGEDILITLDGGPGIIDATGIKANIIATDVQSSNGIVHAIDKVILPQEAIDVVNPTIAGLAMMNADLSILVDALGRAGLVDTLNDRNAEFTVFAPTNTAFLAFLDSLGLDSLDDVPVDVLTQVLLNHVLTGTALSTDLSTGYVSSLATFGGEDNLSMYISTADGVRINGVSSVAAADQTAANGVVHVVDAVIGLPTVVTFATADPTFETLVAALTREDQPDFAGILSTPNGTEPAPFTVFAPTNDAFGDLLAELGLGGLGDLDTATLTATLNYHVIGGANVREEDLSSGDVGTLGGNITINAAAATITDPNGRVINIVVTNVQAANGVVHVINRVILPPL